MTDDRDDIDLAACEELYRQIVVIFRDLARDAEGHGLRRDPLSRTAGRAGCQRPARRERPNKGLN